MSQQLRRKANPLAALKQQGAAGKQRRVIDTSTPFLLFDDAGEGGPRVSRLYRGPIEVIEVHSAADVLPALEKVRRSVRQHCDAAGFLSYEAGYALEPRLAPLIRAPADGIPLLWFGLFEKAEELESDAVADLIGPSAHAWVAPPIPSIGEADHASAFAVVKRHILDGDVYQINLTFPAEVRFGGHPLALYRALRERARAGHGALLFTGSHWILSFSPELFFTLEKGRISARPMKGTARREDEPEADSAAAAALASDAKQRAENLMIVDLVRNDLARVATPGTVQVPELFKVETYPTVHQLVSQVVADIADGQDAVDLLLKTFPCGSVTGAPKIRAMETVADLEPMPRGVYTGSIGWIARNGDAAFNVAIRTLSVRDGMCKASMGLGSGVVADSRADEEWRECLAKGAFVNEAAANFDLLETMAFDPDEGLVDIERHLARMKASAEALGFSFDRHDARNELQAATFRFREPRKLRLRLSRTGAMAIEARQMPTAVPEPVSVTVIPLPVPSSDARLRHKTSDRSFYDRARAEAGTFEVLFSDEEGFLTEGSFTNLFVKRDGILLTPPNRRPLLPGILRERLLANGEAQEADLRAEDLTGTFYVGSVLRGLIRARLD